MTNLTEALQYLDDGADLPHYAAHAAATVLVENWLAALNDGTALEKLLPDVDDVISILRAFKAKVATP